MEDVGETPQIPADEAGEKVLVPFPDAPDVLRDEFNDGYGFLVRSGGWHQLRWPLFGVGSWRQWVDEWESVTDPDTHKKPPRPKPVRTASDHLGAYYREASARQRRRWDRADEREYRFQMKRWEEWRPPDERWLDYPSPRFGRDIHTEVLAVVIAIRHFVNWPGLEVRVVDDAVEVRARPSGLVGPICLSCGAPIGRPRIGRPRRYCSPTCRKDAELLKRKLWRLLERLGRDAERSS